MKIIFDSEQQKENFDIALSILSAELCPCDIDLPHIEKCTYKEKGRKGCLTCWRNCGIEMEVTNAKLNSDKEETD